MHPSPRSRCGEDVTQQPPLEEAEDHVLVRRHVAGDPDAFNELFLRHRDRLWSVGVGVSGDHEVAAEGVREGLVTAFRRSEAWTGETAVGTWLLRLVVQACARVARGTEDAEPVGRPSDRGGRTLEPTLLLHEELRRLPEEQRLPLVLTDMHELPTDEAAHVLHVPAGTIESRCALGRQTLARALRDAGADDAGTSGPAPASDTGGDHQPKGGRG